MDATNETDERVFQKKKKQRKKRKKKTIKTTASSLKPVPSTNARALRDLQTIESINKICNEIKQSIPYDNPVSPAIVPPPRLDSLVTYTEQSLIIRPKPFVPESPENIFFGEADAQIAEEDIILPGCYWGAVGEIPSTTKTAIDNVEKIFNKLKL